MDNVGQSFQSLIIVILCLVGDPEVEITIEVCYVIKLIWAKSDYTAFFMTT